MPAEPHAHSHAPGAGADRRRLAIALGLIVGLLCAEVAVGIVADSLALISDAAHMLTDAGAIGLSLVALSLAARPAAGAMTFGFKRAEILSAQANGALLLVLAGLIVYEAIRRLIDPPDVRAWWCWSRRSPGSRSTCSPRGSWPLPTGRTWPSRAASSTCSPTSTPSRGRRGRRRHPRHRLQPGRPDRVTRRRGADALRRVRPPPRLGARPARERAEGHATSRRSAERSPPTRT